MTGARVRGTAAGTHAVARAAVCGAVPVTVGGARAAVGFSLPADEEGRLEETALRLRGRLERVLTDHALVVRA
ncbi:hypothetical protein [Streptomyces sp. E-08]|uniref:hypothetical protein n=1 Tax=Streptomyces sp. E-08 TaxID=3404047 RepID=UPI003CFA1ED2